MYQAQMKPGKSLQYWRELALCSPSLIPSLTPRLNKYIPITPTPKQAAFLLLNQREALYGGAARGGKSVSLLAAGMQYFDVPGYNALFLRRTLQSQKNAESLLDMCEQWLGPFIGRKSNQVHYDKQAKIFTSPEGATLTFGYLRRNQDVYQYQGAAWHAILLDELTQLLEWAYRYLFSRLTRRAGSQLPIRMRAATNPGGIGHEWVKRRFIAAPASAGRIFLPARLEDNPYVDQAEYEASLSELDPITRAQLRAGDWDITAEGKMFNRAMFEDRILDWGKIPPMVAVCRTWDLAATEPSKSNPDPDYCAGALLGRDKDYNAYILDVRRIRANPSKVEEFILDTLVEDVNDWGYRLEWQQEQEGAASGKITVDYYNRLLAGRGFHNFHAVRAVGSKAERARALATKAGKKQVYLADGHWTNGFIDRACVFPTENKKNEHDDEIDGAAHSFNRLLGPKKSGPIIGIR